MRKVNSGLKHGALTAFLALVVFLCAGRNAKAQSVNCTNGQTPNMTIVIYNNSTDFNIYPVLFAGAASVDDTWLQACFQLTDAQLASHPYPRASQYRMYINCCSTGENGIPPGGSVTITLPLYSPLVSSIDPTKAGQLVDWWQGGGINFYEAPDTETSPPTVLMNHWTSDQSGGLAITPTSNPPNCTGCNLHFFSAPASIPNYDPQQLTEHTLGAQPINPDHTLPNEPARLWDSNNVDYDVSYVNYVYMPAVMEPYGNTLIGYIGSTSSIDDFDTAISNWSAASNPGAGWPQYNDTTGHIVQGKVPSALEIFLNTAAFDNGNVFIPAPSMAEPIMQMVTEWQDCVNNSGTDRICPMIRDVTALLDANYANYADTYEHHRDIWDNQWKCTGAPVGKTNQLLLAHLYGWTPFLENCTNTEANQLYTTPGYGNPNQQPNYQTVKDEFDKLQYWVDVLKGKYGSFDPYVALVHGPTYLNAPYTYAYSVDDAVGNMQTDGSGLIIAVGGPENLPNPDHATPNVNFPYGYSSSYDGGIHFTQYGRCTSTPNTPTSQNFSSFPVPEGIANTSSSIVNCTISMEDSRQRTYLFKLKNLPEGFSSNPFPNPEERAAANEEFIDCSGNTGQVLNWCKTVYPYQSISTDQRAIPNYYVVMGGPPPLDTGAHR